MAHVRRLRLAVGAGLIASALAGHAEQKAVFGDYAVHYVVFNASYLRAQIAERYDIVRGRDKALANVSILDADGQAVEASVSGSFRNLLGQVEHLRFRPVREGDAIYYLAALTYPHAEALRFEIVAELPGYGPARVAFQQTLYWED